MRMEEIPTPAYVIDEGQLIRNLEILKGVQERTGCRILLAQKAFSMFSEYPLIGRYLSGTTASGLFEARLGAEEMGKENHIFSPTYRESEIDEIAQICDHVIFNSFSQLRRFRDRCAGKTSIGLRINPECSTQGDHAIYDPCAPGSRLGITREAFERELVSQADSAGTAFDRELVSQAGSAGAAFDRELVSGADPADAAPGGAAREAVGRTRTGAAAGEKALRLSGVDGLHFHTLCEQNSDDLEKTLQAVEEKFGPYLSQMKWLNMGGGHHITRADYDLERLERCICHMRDTYDLEIYLEPGEAVALNAGYLVTEVMDVVENNGITTLILDASAACHMPDVLEMPYRPPLRGSGLPGEKKYNYRLSSCTCLAGDIIGDYSFDREIHPGDRLYFEDMAIYSMVKNNTFNGIALPSIWVMEPGTAPEEQSREEGYRFEADNEKRITELGEGEKAVRSCDEKMAAESGADERRTWSGVCGNFLGRTCRLVKKFGYEDFKGRLS